jgi:hypothetical protein
MQIDILYRIVILYHNFKKATFDLQMVKSIDVELIDFEGQLYVFTILFLSVHWFMVILVVSIFSY